MFGVKDRLLLGPFNKIYRESNLLRFTIIGHLKDKIAEHSLREGLKISPDKILRAYKNIYGEYWILVEFDRGYDLYKHFRLKAKDRSARRIPRIVVEVCPRCGEDLVDGSCLECGEKVEKPKYVEVWRDPEAVEEIAGPVYKVEKDREYVSFLVVSNWMRVQRRFLYEYVISIVKADEKFYVRRLRL